MKKTLLPGIALILFSSILSAQEQIFIYKRTNGMIQLTSDSDTISLFNYRSTKNRTRDRIVKMGGKTLTLSISKDKERTQTISDADGITTI